MLQHAEVNSWNQHQDWNKVANTNGVLTGDVESVTYHTYMWLEEEIPFYRKPIQSYFLSTKLSTLLRKMTEQNTPNTIEFHNFGVTVTFKAAARRFQIVKDGVSRYNMKAEFVSQRAPGILMNLFQEGYDINRIEEMYGVDADLATDIHVRAKLHAGKSRRLYKDYVDQLATICHTVQTIRT